jgi:hypothetical protein
LTFAQATQGSAGIVSRATTSMPPVSPGTRKMRLSPTCKRATSYGGLGAEATRPRDTHVRHTHANPLLCRRSPNGPLRDCVHPPVAR